MGFTPAIVSLCPIGQLIKVCKMTEVLAVIISLSQEYCLLKIISKSGSFLIFDLLKRILMSTDARS